MTVRTCPHCHQQYSFGKHFRNCFFKNVWSKWNCHHCKNPITFDLNRRMGVGVGVAVCGVLGAMVFDLREMELYWKIILAVLYLGSALFIRGLDTFKKPN